MNNGKATENILDPGGKIVASKRFDGNYENMYFFYNYDARGSVTSIINPDGSLVKGYEYDEFGQTKETGDSLFKNDVKFTGAVHDQSANLYYMNARFYNPSTGRFLTQDTYSGSVYAPWTQHLYVYTGNNPVNYVDPTGHVGQYAMADGGGVRKDKSVSKTTQTHYDVRKDIMRKDKVELDSSKKNLTSYQKVSKFTLNHATDVKDFAVAAVAAEEGRGIRSIANNKGSYKLDKKNVGKMKVHDKYGPGTTRYYDRTIGGVVKEGFQQAKSAMVTAGVIVVADNILFPDYNLGSSDWIQDTTIDVVKSAANVLVASIIVAACPVGAILGAVIGFSISFGINSIDNYLEEKFRWQERLVESWK